MQAAHLQVGAKWDATGHWLKNKVGDSSVGGELAVVGGADQEVRVAVAVDITSAADGLAEAVVGVLTFQVMEDLAGGA